jgi:hypothetical protein
MKYIKSKYYIKPIILNWTVGIVVVGNIFISNYNTQDIHKITIGFLSIIYYLLFIWSLFYLLFNSYSKLEVEYQIEELEKERENKLSYNGIFEKQIVLNNFYKLYEELNDENVFIHRRKSRIELTDNFNIYNYLRSLFVLYLGYAFGEISGPIGLSTFLFLVFACLIYCLWILIWEQKRGKNRLSPIVLSHFFVIFILISWGKNSYIRIYGNEIIGSYLEKSNYRTQYYINLFPNDENSKNYRLPADIHVFTELEEGETTEDRFGQESTSFSKVKYITVEKIYWPNGGYLYFEDCFLDIGEKNLCYDQNNEGWYIELTEEKVK